MISIKIITDSSCDLPEEILKKSNIEMVSLHVTFENNETFIDRVTILPEQFWERMANERELPKTSRLHKLLPGFSGKPWLIIPQ